MDYKNLADNNKNKLTGNFGVPRAMLGDMEGSRSLASATVARKSFWQDTLIVELRKIINKLNVHLVPYCGDKDVFLEEDLSKIEALSEDRGEFAQAFLQTAQAIVQLSGVGVMNEQDGADLIRDRFGVEAEGVVPEDVYEEDEEIMAESASVLLVKRAKGIVLEFLKLGLALDAKRPQERLARLARRHGMRSAQAKTFAVSLAKTLEAFDGDKDKIAGYFDGLKILVDKKAKSSSGESK